MRHSFVDRYAQLDSPLHLLEARTKIIGFSALVVAIVSMRTAGIGQYFGFFFLISILAGISQIPMQYVVARTLLLLPFVVLAALAAPWQGGTGWSWFLLLTARSTLSLVILVLLTNTTRFVELLRALRKLGCPRILVANLSFLYRYVFRPDRRGDAPETGARQPQSRAVRGVCGIADPRRNAGHTAGPLLRARRPYVSGNALPRLFRRVPADRRAKIHVAGSGVHFRRGAHHRRDPLPVRELMPGLVEYAVRITRLNYSYPDGNRALETVDLDIRVGERIALVGPSGAGKSTLLLQLNGILRGSGLVRVMGQSVADGDLKLIRRQVGLVFQDPNDQLFCPTVYEDIAFGPLNLGVPQQEVTKCVEKALADVKLDYSYAGRAAHHLSHGERKRVALATVLAMNPAILALDEPTSNLDPGSRKHLIELIAALPATLILGTHDLEMVLALCQRTVIMDHGKIRADGETRCLLADAELMEKHGLEVPLSLRFS